MQLTENVFTKGVLFHTIKDKPRIFQAMPEDLFLKNFKEGLHEGKVPSLAISRIGAKKPTAKTESKRLFGKCKTITELVTNRDIVFQKFPDSEKDPYVIDNYQRALNIIKNRIKKENERARKAKKDENS